MVLRALALVKKAFSLECELPLLEHGVKTCTEHNVLIKDIISNPPEELPSEVKFCWLSIKKLLPGSCKCMEAPLLGDLRRRLLKPTTSLPKGYLDFAFKTVKSMFSKGWDTATYERHVFSYNPKISSTIGSSVKEGGALSEWAGSQEKFVRICTGQESPDRNIRAECIVVQSSGKPRPLTKFSSSAHVLAPFHRAIYDKLSTQRWLLRGEITPEKLDRAGFSKGEYLVSGDYKSATDNLSIEVAEVIIDAINSGCVTVPVEIQQYAREILRPELFGVGIESFVPRRGQMMGSFLSFPLLCLQNYIAFHWACKDKLQKGHRTPLVINGDDTLFQSSREFADHWMQTVSALGLEVERTKTSILSEEGSLNSTLLRWTKGGKLRVVKTVRMSLLKTPDYPHNLGTSWKKFWRVDHSLKVRTRLAELYIAWQHDVIVRSQVSAYHLGFHGPLAERSLRRCRLWKREVSLESEGLGEVALPPAPTAHNIVWETDDCVAISKEVWESNDVLRDVQTAEATRWRWERARQFCTQDQKQMKKTFWSRVRTCVKASRLSERVKNPFREHNPGVFQSCSIRYHLTAPEKSDGVSATWASTLDLHFPSIGFDGREPSNQTHNGVCSRRFRTEPEISKLVPVFGHVISMLADVETELTMDFFWQQVRPLDDNDPPPYER